MFKTSFSDATSRYCLDVSLFMCCERQLVCELPGQNNCYALVLQLLALMVAVVIRDARYRQTWRRSVALSQLLVFRCQSQCRYLAAF